MRGEYKALIAPEQSPQELPPRARRILFTVHAEIILAGTTSACAENTRMVGGLSRRLRNYLRVRGEYSGKQCKAISPPELPPRARRIRCVSWWNVGFWGTTSACAENTPLHLTMVNPARNYLRVRGEYTSPAPPSHQPHELPPRARRILALPHPPTRVMGTTSACAENTGARA